MTERRVIDGVAVLVVDAGEARPVAEVLEWAVAEHLAAGRIPLPAVSALVDELLSLAAFRRLTSSACATGVSGGGGFRVELDVMSASEFAAAVGVTDGAIRKRCRSGSIPGARRLGRDWAIPRSEIDDEVKDGY